MGRRFSTGVLVGFGALWLVVMVVVIRPWAVEERAAQLDAAQAAGRDLIVALGAPPEADTLGPPEEHRSQRRMWFALAQGFTTQGRFGETLAWYRARLEADGWQPFDQAGWSDFHVDYCRAPWMLAIERDASFEELAAPYHRFTLRLNWAAGITEGHCASGAAGGG